MIQVTLNSSEQELVERVSVQRREHDERNSFKDYRRAKKQSARFIEVNGLGGEIAFCKAMNLFPDIATDQVSKFDATLPNGTKVEIKTTEYGHGKLISRHIRGEADVYVLVTGQMPEYKVVGYITRDNLKSKNTTLNGHEAYVAEQKDLEPIENLLNENRRVHRSSQSDSRRKPRGERMDTPARTARNSAGRTGAAPGRSSIREKRGATRRQ